MSVARLPLLFLILSIAPLASPAWAEEDDAKSASGSNDDGIGLEGWGPRVGLGSNPDQIIGGVHFDLGELARKVEFRPDVVLGFGDDVRSLVFSAPVWYRFDVDARVQPYVGGALAVGAFNKDRQGDDKTDLEFGLQVGGGGEWALKGGNHFHLELRLDLLDVWDVALFAGWTF